MSLRQALTFTPVELNFGTSGLRGLVHVMTDLECYINVAGFLRFLEEHDDLQAGETVLVAGDLRQSTPRIMRVVTQAIIDGGYQPVNCGLIPTPAVAFYGLIKQAPSIMVTGSHIPSDRNGIKFYKRSGEVLKKDEAAIQAAVATVRRREYEQSESDSSFTNDGGHSALVAIPVVDVAAETVYIKRYTDIFASDCLAGKKIVVYQHSAVGRDLIVEVLMKLGASVTPAQRSDVFIPIDSENITAEDKQLFKQLAGSEPETFAVISTDGDSDRPFVIDEAGTFYRGDVLGCVVAAFLGAGFAAVPISSNDAVDNFCQAKGIEVVHTKIGSPYVIAAMNEAVTDKPIVGWEVNGGFLLGCDALLDGKKLKALSTRDALLPILCTLVTATREAKTLSSVFAGLPKSYTGGGLIDNIDTHLIVAFNEACNDNVRVHQLIAGAPGMSQLGSLNELDTTDGLRLLFSNGEVLHLRPSGNAPQFRVYTNADSQLRADQLAANAIASNGYIKQLLRQL